MIKAVLTHSLKPNENGPLVLNECVPKTAPHESESLFSKHLNANGKTVASTAKLRSKKLVQHRVSCEIGHIL